MAQLTVVAGQQCNEEECQDTINDTINRKLPQNHLNSTIGFTTAASLSERESMLRTHSSASRALEQNQNGALKEPLLAWSHTSPKSLFVCIVGILLGDFFRSPLINLISPRHCCQQNQVPYRIAAASCSGRWSFIVAVDSQFAALQRERGRRSLHQKLGQRVMASDDHCCFPWAINRTANVSVCVQRVWHPAPENLFFSARQARP